MAFSDLVDHPKLAHLREILELPRYEAVGILETVWQFTAQYTTRGNIGRFRDCQIEAWVGWDRSRGELIPALVEAGFLDHDDEHRLVVHDWADHCPDYVHSRLIRDTETFHDGRLPSMDRYSDDRRESTLRRYTDRYGDIYQEGGGYVIGRRHSATGGDILQPAATVANRRQPSATGGDGLQHSPAPAPAPVPAHAPAPPRVGLGAPAGPDPTQPNPTQPNPTKKERELTSTSQLGERLKRKPARPGTDPALAAAREEVLARHGAEVDPDAAGSDPPSQAGASPPVGASPSDPSGSPDPDPDQLVRRLTGKLAGGDYDDPDKQARIRAQAAALRGET